MRVEGGDPFKEQRAYNLSIYTMVAVPYLLFGWVGFRIYRGLRQKARSDQLADESPRQPVAPSSPDEGARP